MNGKYKGRGLTIYPLQGGCSLFGVLIIGGSTVLQVSESEVWMIAPQPSTCT